MGFNQMIVSLKVLLGVEMVGSRQVAHYLRTSLTIGNKSHDDDSLVWFQVLDYRIPHSGTVEINDREATITFRIKRAKRLPGVRGASRPAMAYHFFRFRLEGLTSLNSSSSGKGLCRIHRSEVPPILTNKTNKFPSPPNMKNVRVRGTGTWEITRNSWNGGSVNTRYLTTAWKVGGSNSAGGGAAVVATIGNFTLTDPQGNEWTYQYAGGGAGAGVKAPSSKILEDVLNIGKCVGLEQLPSTGGILKNPLVFGGRELKKEDFCGMARWFEASLIVGLGLSGTLFVIGRPPVPSVCIFMAGVTCGGGAGGGILGGYIKSTF